MTMTEQSMVIGVLRDRTEAEQVVSDLKQSGFHDDQIRLLGHETGGFLAGLRHMFSGQENTTDDADDLAHLGIPQNDIHYYQGELDAGHSIVAVQAYDRRQEAYDIMSQHGAYNATTHAGNVTNTATGAMTDATQNTQNTPDALESGDQTISLRGEELQVHKTWVQTSEVRIYKRIITEQKTFTVPVQREEVVIERVPFTGGTANRQLDSGATDVERQSATTGSDVDTDADATIKLPADLNRPANRNVQEMLKEDGTIRILVREEQVVINKQPVVVEEIVVRKQHVQEMRQIADTVRREEVHVERTGNVTVRDNIDNIENPVNTTE